MGDREDMLAMLNQVMDKRLHDMTAVVTEAQRSAGAAAGAAMKVTGQFDEMRRNVADGFKRVEMTQAEHGARQVEQAGMIRAIATTCRERRITCDGRFKDAADAIDRAFKEAERDYRRELKLAHARISKVERVSQAESKELNRKLSDVREDTGVRHVQDIERQALERGRADERAVMWRRLASLGKLLLKVVVALALAGGGSVGVVELLKFLMGG